MSAANEITRICNAKTALKNAINAKTDSSHKITNERLDEYADYVRSIQGEVSVRFSATLQALAERKSSYFETFAYDGARYGVIDLSALDGTAFEIKDIGQRTFNSFAYSNEGDIRRKIRIVMPKRLLSISGANWTAGAEGKYYDFSGYLNDSPPVYSSSTATLGTNEARILVPKRLETEWKNATGWAAFSDKIIGVEEVYS